MTMLRRGCSVTVMVVVMRMGVRVIVVMVMGHNVCGIFHQFVGLQLGRERHQGNCPD